MGAVLGANFASLPPFPRNNGRVFGGKAGDFPSAKPGLALIALDSAFPRAKTEAVLLAEHKRKNIYTKHVPFFRQRATSQSAMDWKRERHGKQPGMQTQAETDAL